MCAAPHRNGDSDVAPGRPTARQAPREGSSELAHLSWYAQDASNFIDHSLVPGIRYLTFHQALQQRMVGAPEPAIALCCDSSVAAIPTSEAGSSTPSIVIRVSLSSSSPSPPAVFANSWISVTSIRAAGRRTAQLGNQCCGGGTTVLGSDRHASDECSLDAAPRFCQARSVKGGMSRKCPGRTGSSIGQDRGSSPTNIS